MACDKACPESKTCSGKCRALGRVGDLCRSGMASLSLGDHFVAERVLLHALEMTREFDLGPVLEAKAFNNFGLVLHAQGRRDDARNAFERAMHLIRGRVGTENQLYRTVRKNYRETLVERDREERSGAVPVEWNGNQTRSVAVAPGGTPCRN
ncbi:MAG: tetratricopeptide repeat protein [Desulfovibrio sp.]